MFVIVRLGHARLTDEDLLFLFVKLSANICEVDLLLAVLTSVKIGA